MILQRLNLVLAAAMAAAVAATSSGQTAEPAANAPSMADFTGLWAHSALGFESPISGPGPVTNKSRLPSGAGDFAKIVGDYTNPILKPEAAEIVKKFGEISLT